MSTIRGSCVKSDDGEAKVRTNKERARFLALVAVAAGLPVVFLDILLWLDVSDVGSCITEAASLSFPFCLLLWILAKVLHDKHDSASELLGKMAHHLYWVCVALLLVGEVAAAVLSFIQGEDLPGAFSWVVYGVCALSVVLKLVSSSLARRDHEDLVARRMGKVAFVLSVCVWWLPILLDAVIASVLLMATSA